MKKATLIKFLRQPYFNELLQLHRADILGSNGDLSQWTYAKEKYEELKDALNPQPLINGDTLTELGFTPSPLFGEILGAVETRQLEGLLKDREEAIKYVELIYGKDKK